MKETILYCNKDKKKRYWHFYPSVMQVEMCLNKEEYDTILKTKVIEDSNGNYCAWWDNKDKRFTFVYPDKRLVEMCFTYGSKVEIERGNGLILQVRIEELIDENNKN